jgi:serine/threonine protein kinase
MHGLGICHRDLKAENIVFTGSKQDHHLEIKLIDFGLSKFF